MSVKFGANPQENFFPVITGKFDATEPAGILIISVLSAIGIGLAIIIILLFRKVN